MFDYSSRLFTFGCSFTQYIWPTWADILGKEFAYYENWGQRGAGNHYIFYSLIECIERNKITSNDTIIIMWSGSDREDRYINNTWQTPGGLGTQKFYNRNFIENYYDKRGHQLTDLLTITATKKLLESQGIDYKFLSMLPFIGEESFNLDQDLANFFSNTTAAFNLSAYEVLYKNSWSVLKNKTDFVKLLNKTEQRKLLEEQYPIFAGADWPSLEDFLNDKIEDQFREEMKKFNLFEIRDYGVREDNHPIPTEHLTYLQTIWPDIVISEETKKWVNEYKLFDQFDSHQPKNIL
jgi:hypothetical protein